MAREMQIDSVILLGRGEENTGGRNKNAILADALEAVIGALYLDSGYKAAFTFMSRYMKVEIERVLNRQYYLDYKSELQELSQHRYKSYPVYRLLKRAGPEHERYFWIEVTVNGKTYGPGMGKNKKTAEQEAARMAYEQVKG
jgi:ribonuclease-3